MNRQEKLQHISQNPDVSVLVVGGGVNGLATFRDLALQGVDVLLVERADYCSGSSAASSHMAHGGIRYLENAEFRLVNEAVKERNRLILNAPQYVKPLPTVIPMFKWFSGLFNAPLKFLGLLNKPAERGGIIIKMGLLMYDAYTGKQRTVPRHEFFGRKKSLATYPQLNPDIVSIARYYDGLIRDPERLCVELALDAEAESPSAMALNYVSVSGAEGNTVRLRDETSGETIDIRPKVVVNAAGPWIDFANQALQREGRMIGGTKGSHLVVNHPELRAAIGENEFFFENKDGRIVLLCPLENRVLVGTSDIRLDDPDEAVCTDEEIDYFTEMVSKVFPNITIDRSHIVFTYSGVRPLPASDANTTGQISRDHSIRVTEPTSAEGFPILSLVGGKWTTFRAFGEQATDQLLARLGRPRRASTANLPIGGGVDYPKTDELRAAWLKAQVERSGLTRQRVETLFYRYGTRAALIIDEIIESDSPDILLDGQSEYSQHEVAFIARHEQLVHLDDFIMRRSNLAMLGEVNKSLLENLATVIGETLGWSRETRQAEVKRTITLLRERHRVDLS